MNFNSKNLPSFSLNIFITSALSVFTANSLALDYGVFDARALSMGGATVASASGQHAQFYNPALLSMYTGEEEQTHNGRIYLPILVAQVSEDVEDTIDVVDENFGDALSDAVDVFNNTPTPANAGGVSTASRNLQTAIVDVGNQELNGEAFLGFSVSEPSHREGGAFYFGIRAIGGGRTTVTPEDLSLLQDYIEELDSVAAGNAPGALHPELIDDDDNLIDPRDNITSSANIRSMAIAEWGVSLSKEFELWGQPIAVGITPKIMRVDIYVEDLTYGDSDLNYDDDKRSHLVLNSDVGIAVPLGKYFRLGLASKDIFAQKYTAGSGLSVEAKARSRFGAAFVQKYLTFGLDVDLQKNESLGAELPGQEMAAGLELRPLKWLDVRLGYRQDLEGFKDDVLSGGVGFRAGWFVADLSYAKSQDIEGGSLQLGWAF